MEEALDILSREPATARHVSRQIALYFVADDPPPTLVEHMAQTFQRTDGDIAAVLDTMIMRGVHASLGTRFKDRCATSSPPCASPMTPRSSPTPRPSRAGSTGSLAKVCTTTRPGRLSLDLAAWTASGQMTLRFEIAARSAAAAPAVQAAGAGCGGPAGLPAAAEQPVFLQPDAARLSPTTRNALEQAVSPQDWNTLFLSSPEFMQ